MTRDELIAAVLADPDALLAVQCDRKVAGEWVSRTFPYEPDHVQPFIYHSVRRYPTRSSDTCGDSAVEVRGFNNGLAIAQAWYGEWEPFASTELAEAWCDERLRKAGVRLAVGTDG